MPGNMRATSGRPGREKMAADFGRSDCVGMGRNMNCTESGAKAFTKPAPRITGAKQGDAVRGTASGLIGTTCMGTSENSAQQKFAIAFRSKNGGLDGLGRLAAEIQQCLPNLFDRSHLCRFIAHDTSFAH